MPGFGDDGAYVWPITLLGLLTPLVLVIYVSVTLARAKSRLERLKQTDTDQA